jgi:hypothetical protein
MARHRRKNRKIKMPSNEKKEPLENLKDKFRSFFGLKDPQEKTGSLPPKARFSIWYFLIVFLTISYLQQHFFSGKVETIPYSQFKQSIGEGKVNELIIGPENINGTLIGTPGQKFTTVRVNDPNLVKELDELKVGYSGRYESKFLSALLSWVIPIGIFFLIWRFAMKKMGPGMGVMSFSKSKAKIFAESDTKVSFADAAGIDEAKAIRVNSRNWGGEFPKGCFWSARRVPVKPFWPGLWPERPKCLFSASAGLSLWKCLSVWAQPAFAIFSLRPQAKPPASSLSMNWTRWGKPGE